jgi:hypothetical protein
MMAQPVRPAAAVITLPDADPAMAPAGGSAYRNSSPMTVPASSSGLYLSCVYADLATICHRLASVSYGRTLVTVSPADVLPADRPSQVRCRFRLISWPIATSSISAPLIGSRPVSPSALARTSMQPPAAAAVRDPGVLTFLNGYSCAKK